MAHQIGDYRTFTEEKAAEFVELHKNFINTSVQWIKKAINKGELRDIPVDAVNSMIHGAMHNMMATQWNSGTVEELKCKIDYFIDILFNGISKEKETSK